MTQNDELRKQCEKLTWDIALSDETDEQSIDRVFQFVKAQLAQAEVPKDEFTTEEVNKNESIGWFSHSGIVFQIVEIGRKARIVGRLKATQAALDKEQS